MDTLQFTKPPLPDSVLEVTGETGQVIRPAFGSVVAIPIVASWGPLGFADAPPGVDDSRLLRGFVPDFSRYEAVYGSSDTAGRDAVVGAFNGMGVDVGGGAGGIFTYRMATNAAAKASTTIQNTTPANALHLDAVYPGTDGNLISYVVEDDPVTVANDRLRILFRGATVESYSYPQTDITNLATQINARSSFVRAVIPVLLSGVALGPTSQAGVALAGGNDGASLDAAAWQAALDALAFKDFGIFAPFNLTDASIKAQIFQWMRDMAANMRPVRVLDGGAAGEGLAAAITDANLFRDEHRVRLGIGTYHDDLLNKDLSTAQLAPRLAGVLAARGLRSALTRAELGGLSSVVGAGPDELVAARDAGVTVFRQISSPVAELAISQGVTTFIDQTNVAKPYKLWREPRIVGLFDYVVRRMSNYGNDNIVGDLPVVQSTRDTVRKELSKLMDFLVDEQLAQPGTTSFDVIATESDPSLDDAIPYWFKFKPTRTANYLVGKAKVS